MRGAFNSVPRHLALLRLLVSPSPQSGDIRTRLTQDNNLSPTAAYVDEEARQLAQEVASHMLMCRSQVALTTSRGFIR